MKILFKDLKIGERFHDGISSGSGIHSDDKMWMEYEKTSPSKGLVIRQNGYGNSRLEGTTTSFAPFKNVWTLNQ